MRLYFLYHISLAKNSKDDIDFLLGHVNFECPNSMYDFRTGGPHICDVPPLVPIHEKMNTIELIIIVNLYFFFSFLHIGSCTWTSWCERRTYFKN